MPILSSAARATPGMASDAVARRAERIERDDIGCNLQVSKQIGKSLLMYAAMAEARRPPEGIRRTASCARSAWFLPRTPGRQARREQTQFRFFSPLRLEIHHLDAATPFLRHFHQEGTPGAGPKGAAPMAQLRA